MEPAAGFLQRRGARARRGRPSLTRGGFLRPGGREVSVGRAGAARPVNQALICAGGPRPASGGALFSSGAAGGCGVSFPALRSRSVLA